MDVSRRDFFASTADLSWMKGEFGELMPLEFIASKVGINPPTKPITMNELTRFLTRAEIIWRWKYADLMMKGRD